MKLCKKCDTKKPLTEFHRRGEGHNAWCKTCRKEYDKRYWQKNRDRRRKQTKVIQSKFRDWYRSLKNGPCVDCGGEFHFAAMQWDHVRGEKIGDLGELLRRGNKTLILAEIEKCDLVCANCHAIRTHERRSSG